MKTETRRTKHSPPRRRESSHLRGGKGKTGQATLELSVALIVVMLLLVAAARLFVWLNNGMVNRQAEYENTRVSAADSSTHSDVLNIYSLDNVSKTDLQFVDTTGSPVNEVLVNATLGEVNLFI